MHSHFARPRLHAIIMRKSSAWGTGMIGSRLWVMGLVYVGRTKSAKTRRSIWNLQGSPEVKSVTDGAKSSQCTIFQSRQAYLIDWLGSSDTGKTAASFSGEQKRMSDVEPCHYNGQ